MDRTRAAFGNDAAWNGHRARTWKHYILSPNPTDGIELPRLRGFATAWAKENFGDYEVAIVYHDDNEGRIPHAHVVVNNTNLATGRRIQEPDPRGGQALGAEARARHGALVLRGRAPPRRF